MADKKISELTAATVVAGADVFVTTQDGVTKKVAASVVKDYIVPTPTVVNTALLTDMVLLGNNKTISIGDLKTVLGVT